MFQGSFKSVSRKIEGCFKRVFSGFQGYLKEVRRNFKIGQMCFKRVLRVL